MTVDTLLDRLPRLALPHFQRGQVWREVSISLLFESLMLDTPCGSIILWEPPGEVLDFGEPVEAWGTTQPEFLVVDGQQRLTALGLVLGSGQRWALNLAAVPEFLDTADVRPERRLRARPLFAPIPDDVPPGANDRRRASLAANLRDLVPLSAIERSGVAAWPYEAPPTHGDGVALWAAMVEGVQAIRGRRLQVVVKRQEPLRAIVELYNRINSAGVTVRQEEKSFAAMVAFEPGAASWLRDCFADTHPHKVPGADPTALTHTTLVNREREQRFGFPLFIRSFAQTASHHLDRDGADIDGLPALLADPVWQQAGDARTQVLDESRQVLANTARVLRDVLACDDYRFLPSAEAIRPAIALQLKYPDMEDALIARAVLACQIDALLPEPASVRNLLRRLRASNRLEDAVAALPTPDLVTAVRDSLAGAQSMQHPWVSIMYWYQRTRQARDYGGWYLPLTLHSKAHKEHVVPFSLLHPAYPNLTATGHSRAHEANAIGNLTFLSAQFNFDHGADPVALEHAHAGLLVAHHLDSRDLLAAYRTAVDALTDRRYADGVVAYRTFVKIRTDALTLGMTQWMATHLEYSPDNPTARPAVQKVRLSPADEVRQRDWPEDFQYAVLELVRDIPLGARHHWVLRREGTGNARTQISHQIRLSGTGTQLMVGCNTGGSRDLVTALTTALGPAKDETPAQWVFRLHPSDPRSALGLRLLREALEGRPIPGPTAPAADADFRPLGAATPAPVGMPNAPAAPEPHEVQAQPCDLHGLTWCAQCADVIARAKPVELPSVPPDYDGPRPRPQDILISPTGIAHRSGCTHLPDATWLIPPRWGWSSDATQWSRIGNGHALRATAGNLDRIATRRCNDCDS